MKKWIKTLFAVMIAALTLFGAAACGAKVETPQFIKEYICGDDHVYGTGEVERWATCIREGRVKYTCQECGHEKIETLVRTKHTPYTVPAREATCGQTGYTEHTACAVCGTVLDGKETIAKTPCQHEEDYYAGMGIYACPYCQDERAEYQETLMTVYQFNQNPISETRAWYRVYLPKSDSQVTITFKSKDLDRPFGNHEINEIYEMKFVFNADTFAEKYIILGDGTEPNAWCDITHEIGPDYIDLCFGERFFELYHEDCLGDCGFRLSPDLVKVTDLTVSGGAKIVMLQGVEVGQRP